MSRRPVRLPIRVLPLCLGLLIAGAASAAPLVDRVPDISDRLETHFRLASQNDGDSDGDGLIDDDLCPHDSENDVDGDGICGDMDNCPALANPSQQDIDGDGVGDACDE